MSYTIPIERVQDLEDLRAEIADAIANGSRVDLQQVHDTLRASLDHVAPLPRIERVPHGDVLTPANIDYSDASRLGKVIVEYRNGPKEYGLQITVSDFEFEKASSCRDHVTKACAWARDVLAAAVEVDRLAPGGTLITVAG